MPADVWRWYLLANAPESSDASFAWEQFRTTVNGDLGNVLGNFTNRILSFTASRFDGRVPKEGMAGDEEAQLAAEVAVHLAAITAEYEAMEYRKAAAATRALWAAGNEYLTRTAPWTKIKSDRDTAATAVRTALNLIPLFARVGAPMISATAARMLAAVGEEADATAWPEGDAAALLDALPRGRAVENPGPMFEHIDDERLASWMERFPGGEG
jgi:methionyl-tRNA synthetase